MQEFELVATIPNLQSSITFGEDCARVKLDIPLHTDDQQQGVMLMQLLRKKVLKLKISVDDNEPAQYREMSE